MSIFQNSENKAKPFEEDLTKKDFYSSLKNMQNEKSQKEFYARFLNELKKIFLDSVSEAKKRETDYH